MSSQISQLYSQISSRMLVLVARSLAATPVALDSRNVRQVTWMTLAKEDSAIFGMMVVLVQLSRTEFLRWTRVVKGSVGNFRCLDKQ